VFDELNEKMLQKEVRLREEALKKFVEVEKIFQKEENERMNFEKHLREDVDTRYAQDYACLRGHLRGACVAPAWPPAWRMRGHLAVGNLPAV